MRLSTQCRLSSCASLLNTDESLCKSVRTPCPSPFKLLQWTFAFEVEKEAPNGDILELLPNYIDLVHIIYVETWIANYDTLRESWS